MLNFQRAFYQQVREVYGKFGSSAVPWTVRDKSEIHKKVRLHPIGMKTLNKAVLGSSYPQSERAEKGRREDFEGRGREKLMKPE